MKEMKNPSKKRKGATVSLVICFVAAIVMVGTYTFRHYKNGMQEQLSELEEGLAKEETGLVEENSEASTKNIVIETPQKTKEDAASLAQNEEMEEEVTQATDGSAAPLNFQITDQLLWPVDGNILLNYSMDKTVYFSTLDQYKYNPALIISGEVKDPVKSSARGVVKSIDVTAQTGTTVTVDLGNGYEVIYGQLKEVPVKTGDYVNENAIIGYLSEPTKYYSVEGCNLYFQMLKDGQPVNPMEYLED